MKNILINLFIVSAVIFAGACDLTDHADNNNNGDTGKLIIKITDDPFDISYIESATVTITKVEIRKEDDDEGYPFLVLSEDTVTFDLIDLRNGITEDLLSVEIPVGNYDLIRLYVGEASLKIKNQPDVFKVKVPSGEQTGIKIFISPSVKIAGGLTSEVLLDFDLSRSFVMRGNLAAAKMNGFIFKPVIRASNLSTAGRIEGIVSDTTNLRIADAKVWIQQDTVLATSFTDTLGYYAFIGIPEGTYSISATRENYDTVAYSGIKVVAGNRTIQNFILREE